MAWRALDTAHMGIRLVDILHPQVHILLRDIHLRVATLLKVVIHPRAIIHRDTRQQAMLRKGIHQLVTLLQAIMLRPHLPHQLMDMGWAVEWGQC